MRIELKIYLFWIYLIDFYEENLRTMYNNFTRGIFTGWKLLRTGEISQKNGEHFLVSVADVSPVYFRHYQGMKTHGSFVKF